MPLKKLILLLFYFVILSYIPVSNAHKKKNCPALISFISFQSIDLEQQPPGPLTIKGKLKLPARSHGKKGCSHPKKRLPAVVILHGSEGVGFQGEFYAKVLNSVGIATLEIDMWEARGITDPLDRPPLPLINFPDAFAALRFLSNHPNIDYDRIGVMGFSWGGVISMEAATELYSSQFGNGLRFAAHVAHYPVCYAFNSFIPGTEFVDLTGAPVLIQIGEEDDYDLGSSACFALKDSLPFNEQNAVEVVAYKNAFHEWDRLLIPTTVQDPFSNLGAGGDVEIVPNVKQANKSRKKAVQFFLNNL